MAVVGFLVNDSGLVIPAFVALVLAPLLVAAGPVTGFNTEETTVG